MQIIKKWLLVDINWTGTDYLVSNQAAARGKWNKTQERLYYDVNNERLGEAEIVDTNDYYGL